MKNKNYKLALILLTVTFFMPFLNKWDGLAKAQMNLWNQKASFISARVGSTAFSIGSKGYLGMGYDGTVANSDFWEYDPVLNTWTQKASFGGGATNDAAGFSVGTKGYVVMCNSVTASFYEYDQLTNVWTARAPFPGTASRTGALAFTIGTKGYVGLGFSAGNPLADFYEYDPSANTWSTKANYGGGPRYWAVGFGIGTKGYVGTGYGFFGHSDDFYEYDPATNAWTLKAVVPGGGRQGATAFSINTKGYIALGTNLSAALNDIQEYDPASNTWLQRAYYGGAARGFGANFVIGGTAYVGMGRPLSGAYYNDIWAYSGCAPVVTSTPSNLFICGTGTTSVSYSGNAGSYTWSPGATNSAPFSPTATTSYTLSGSSTSGTCANTSNSAIVTVIVNTPPLNQAVTVASSSFCASGSTSVMAAASQTNVNYYLRNNSNNAVLQGPLPGTGGALNFTTGLVSTTTTYNVLGKKLSNALNFDGTNDFVQTNVDADMDAMPVTTWEAWIYPTDGGFSDWKMVLTMEDGSWDRSIAIRTGSFVVGHSTDGWFPVAVDLNQWQHIAVAYSNSVVKFYKNGVEYVLLLGEGNHQSVGNFVIGADQFGLQNYQGKVDDVRIWNTTRTQAQIQSNMNSCLTGAEAGLVAYYPFENGTGSSVVSDAAGGDNPGFLMNMNVNADWVNGVENCGCTTQMSALPTVSINPFPVIVAPNATICSGYSHTFTPTGAGGAGTYTLNAGSNFTVSPVTATSYTISGTTSLNCTSSIVATVSVNLTPSLSVSTGSICSGKSFTFSPTGATAGSSYSINGGNNFTVSPLTTTNYSIIATGTNNCVSPNTVVTVTVSSTPTISVNSGTACTGKVFTITPTGIAGVTFAVTGGNFTVTPSSATNYTVTGTSTAGCISSPVVSSLVVNVTPTVTVNSPTICSGYAATLVPNNAATYTINGGNTFVFSPAATTIYTLAGSSAGCTSATLTTTITVNASPTLGVNSGSVCEGQLFTFVPTGASTYSVNGVSIFTIMPSSGGDYTITGTAANGCQSPTVAISSVTVSPSPTIIAGSYSVCEGNSVTIVPGGNLGGTYSITGGSFLVSPSVSTTYSITGNSVFGCPSTNTAIVTVSVNVTPTLTVSDYTICSGQVLTITPTGAPGGTYSISGNSFTVSPSINFAYIITGISASGCPASNTVVSSVTVNASPTIAVTNSVICAGQGFTVDVPGVSSFSINGVGSIISVTPATTGSYSITASNAMGCVSGPVLLTVTVNPTPALTTTSSLEAFCAGETKTVTLNGSGTANSYTWVNTNQSTLNIIVSPTVTTTYTLQGTGFNGCVGSSMVMITVDPCTGLNTVKESSVLLSLYPNPNAGIFTLETGFDAEITILNSTGQVILQTQVGSGKTLISVKELANGIYFVKANANGKQEIIKIIKE